MAYTAELSLQGFSRSQSAVPQSNALHLHWRHCRRVFRRTQNLNLPPTEDEPLGPSHYSQFEFSPLVLSEFLRQIWISLEQLNFPTSLHSFLCHKITDFAMGRPSKVCPPILIVARINLVQRLYVDCTPRPLEFIPSHQLDESLNLGTPTEGPEVESHGVVDETFIPGGTTEGWGRAEIESHTFFEAFVPGIPAEVGSPLMDGTSNPETSTEGWEDAYTENNSISETLERGRREKWATRGREETTCCVCLEELSEEAEVMILECEHIFHQECILTWMKQNERQTCPLCRRQIWSRSAPLHPSQCQS